MFSPEPDELSSGRPYPEELKGVQSRLEERYEFIAPIQQGGTAAVYKLRLRVSGHYVCLKTALPGVCDFASIRSKLEREKRYLAPPIRHRCLPQIYDADVSASTQPYLIATYHPGATFAEHLRLDKPFSLEATLYIVLHLVGVLRYLHTALIVHRDLHIGNILVDRDVIRFGLLLIDYGSSARADSSSPLVTTSEFGPGMIEPPGTWEACRVADFSKLGNVLWQMRSVFIRSALFDVREEYDRLCAELRNGSVTQWDEVDSLVATLIDPNLAINRAKHVFFDTRRATTFHIPIPVLKAVQVTDSLRYVVECPEFQALKGLQQLSFCSEWFPGATHTRFEHSLGVFALCRTALRTLCDQSAFRHTVTADDVRGLLAAALLHDCGHYPFAHPVEQYAAAHFPIKTHPELHSAVKHGSRSRQMLAGAGRFGLTDLRRMILSCVGEAGCIRAVKVLQGAIPNLSPLIDGPVDCDKLDYLPRDALHCGVPFGDGLDTDALIRGYCLSATGGIAISLDGLPAAEGMLALQQQMLSGVYWHEQVRARFTMFHELLDRLTQDEGPSLFPRNCSADLFLDLATRLQNCVSESDAIQHVLAPMAFNRNCSALLGLLFNPVVNLPRTMPYSCISVHPITEPIPRDRECNIYATVFAPGASSISWGGIARLKASWIRVLGDSFPDLYPYEILIDAPFGKTSHLSFNVKLPDGSETPVESYSHFKLSALGQPAAYCSPVRVYASHRIAKIVNSHRESFLKSFSMVFYGQYYEDPSLRTVPKGGAF